MIVLGFDTSCYSTSVALVDEKGVISSRRRLLSVAGGERGLRQSEAVFAHVRALSGLLSETLHDFDGRIDAVCASASPRDGADSYMPVFLVGAGQAQSIAAALRVPYFETTHQRGHIRAAKLDSGLTKDDFLALHLSGGTTDVLYAKGDKLIPLGTSLDLHAGQLVDRIGVKLGLPFPAGPALEKLAEGTAAQALVPVAMEEGALCCHLSGAEAQLNRMIDAGLPKAQAAAEVYSVIARSVLRLLTAAAKKTGVNEVLLAGGVISSARLRDMLTERNAKRSLGLHLFFGKPELSGDNAVGVALLGAERMKDDGDDFRREAAGC